MSRDHYDPKLAYLWRGVSPHGSINGDYPPDRHASGYTTRAHVQIPDRRLAPYLGDLADGGTVVDLWCCNWNAVADIACGGPMMDPDLGPGEVRRFVDGKTTPAGIGGPAGSLDYVDAAAFIDARRRIGARIGRRCGSVVRWEDGTETPIPSESARWGDHAIDACLETHREQTDSAEAGE